MKDDIHGDKDTTIQCWRFYVN